MVWNSAWPFTARTPRLPGGLQSSCHLLSAPLTWHPLGDLMTHESTGPADRGFHKAQATPVPSLGGISPDPGMRRELDLRPLGCACAGVPRGPDPEQCGLGSVLGPRLWGSPALAGPA